MTRRCAMLACKCEEKFVRPVRGLSALSLVPLLLCLGAQSATGKESREEGGEERGRVRGDVPAFRVIVNLKNPVSSMSRARVASLFAKDASSWNDGAGVTPVDLPGDSVTRRAFSLDILEKEVATVVRHWEQQQSLSIAEPPLQRASDGEVLEYVKTNAGAIGYVSGATATSGVKVVTVTGFRMIINSSNPISLMSKAKVGRMLLKKTTKWRDGEKAKPVDQGRSSVARELFSKKVLGKTVRQVMSYWQQKVFSGRAVPPPQMKSDREVLDYVKANRGAIGYVSRRAPLKGVKVLRVTE
jgi:ABC-type phosphate transport system substrate-binding protein